MTSNYGNPLLISATTAELVSRATTLAAAGSRKILGIVGAPGSGKSTLCDVLAAQLGRQAVAVGMDGFHLDNSVLESLGRMERKGASDTFDIPGYVALLRRLRSAEDEVTYAPRFYRSLEMSIGSAVSVPRSTPLVVTEGNYLLHDRGGWQDVAPLLDEVWFLDVPSPERRRRLITRRISRGETTERAQAWVDDVDEVNALIVTRSSNSADLLVRLVD